MPSDSFPTAPKNKSLESLKKTFKQKLDSILYKQLTIENIETFADEALNETITLTGEILKEYKSNSEFKKQPNLDTKQEEDEAYRTLELPDINEILQSIISKKEQIASLKTYIQNNTENVDTVITPPQENKEPEIVAGANNFAEKRIFPRLVTLLYILENDFDIKPTPEDVLIKEGKVTPEMFRKTPYVRVEIPGLNRAVYVCEEEGNTSYIFDIEKLTEKGLILDEIDLDDKGDKNSLIAYHPGIGVRIIQSKRWRSRMSEALGEPILEILSDIPRRHEREERERVSEFEKKEWLPFEHFQSEIKELYPGQGNVSSWYKKEYKKHTSWPSNPGATYKDKGWIGWPELVDKDNRTKKEYSSFEDFQTEVRNLYTEGGVAKWYEKEKNKHSSWPAAPDKKYKDKGWIGWPELVGEENRLKKEYLSFKDFKLEVIKFYPGEVSVHGWYMQEYKKHLNWPSRPEVTYEGIGWYGWPELVDKENLSKKEYLSFTDFKNEVKTLYSGKGSIYEWYSKEYKKHLNWPSHPGDTYKGMGWDGWSKLVDKENPFKKEYLSFGDFQNEVKALYTGGGVAKWYEKEHKNHSDWPSSPHKIYKGKGWLNWLEMVGKKKE